MLEIDKQIEKAKKKPLTAENLNYIGDLYMKRGEQQKAVAYFFEAVDKLHFAQKEKKMAIYKKIIKISPSSEKAYEGIIEILSIMGLVMEEKKYLHLLGQIYEEKGDHDKARELLEKVRELDPHVSIPGSFFHAPRAEEMPSAVPEEGIPDMQREEGGHGALPELEKEKGYVAPETAEEPQEKLIEASIEGIKEEGPVRKVPVYREPAVQKKTAFPIKYLVAAMSAVVLAIAAILFFVPGRIKQKSADTMPPSVSAVQGDIEVTLTMLGSPDDLAGILSPEERAGRTFAEVSVRAVKGCIPDAFASSPYGMISLLDTKGTPTGTRTIEGLQKATKIIYRTNVCGKEHGAVFMRMVLPLEKDLRYSGMTIDGIEKTGPVALRWGGR
jgi:hypothetical protein